MDHLAPEHPNVAALLSASVHDGQRAIDAPRLEAVLAPDAWRSLMQDVETAFSVAERADGARRLTHHLVNLELRQAGLVSYSADLAPPAADLLATCADAGISEAVRAAVGKRL